MRQKSGKKSIGKKWTIKFYTELITGEHLKALVSPASPNETYVK